MNEYITDASKIKKILLENKASYSAYAGYFCSYFPSELLYGFNVHPVRILGYSKNQIQRRDLINYVCSYIADIITAFESDHFVWADHLIVPATCDSLYGAREYLEQNIEGLNVKMFRPPLKFDEGIYQFYKSSVEDMLEWMGSYYSFDDVALTKGIEMKNHMNSVIIDLLSGKDGLFKGTIYLKLMLAKSILPYHLFISLIDRCDKDVLEQNFSLKRDNILTLGPICDNLDLIDYLNAEHNVITGLMTTTLGVHDSEIPLEGDVKDNLIRYYFNKLGTVTSYNYFNIFIKKLDREIIKHSIKGIVYLNYKFCEPHMFFSKQLRDYLENSDMKYLYLEIEHVKGMDALTQNKIDAFMETL